MKNSSEIVVIGLGKTGLSCARFLRRQKKSFIVMDSRTHPPELEKFQQEFPETPLFLGDFDLIVLSTAKQLIVSPGVSLKEKAIKEAIDKGVDVIGDIELFARYVKSPVIAITGSNAKSTVTTLVGELLQSIGLNVAVGGNLGIPALDLLVDPSPDYFVLELSSFQLEETSSLVSRVATVLNVSLDHMDRYESFSDYVAAKQKIYAQSVNQVVNRQDKNSYPFVAATANITSFGLDAPKENEFGLCDEDGDVVLCFGEARLLSTKELRIKGQHNWMNALAALAICHAAGISVSDVLPALKKFSGLAHRCEFVAEKNAVSWYNDSKGTNVGATVAALLGLGSVIAGKLIWIAGGIGKNADFSPLKDPVKKYVRIAILIGQDAKLIEETLASDVQVVHADSLEAAVNMARSVATANDAVLLSPACASFDMFQNFEHRGDVFKHLVCAL